MGEGEGRDWVILSALEFFSLSCIGADILAKTTKLKSGGSQLQDIFSSKLSC